MYWGKFAFQNPHLARAYTWREICVSKSVGLAYSWKEIFVSNLPKGVTETRLEDAYVDLSKTQPCKYIVCLYRPRKSCISQDWIVNYANRDKLWLFSFWLQSFGTRNSSLANTKIYTLLYCFCSLYFVFQGNFQVQDSEGRFNGVVCVTSLAGLYLEGLNFGILRYLS